MISLQLKVLLVDDEQICLDAIKASLSTFNYISIAGEADNGTDAVKFLQNHEVDLIFLDIDMKDINGFELAKHIQYHYPDIMIIFLTGYAGFALKGYEYRPVDFLTKPVNLLRLEQALSRVKELKGHNKPAKEVKIGINVEGGFEIINVKDISYIEKRGRKICIICENGEIFNCRDSLQKLEHIFSEHSFFRSHQSFLVPIEKIKSIRIDDFKRSYLMQLKDKKEELPLSRDKYNELKELLLQRGIKFY
ncbi:LytR/AlgR family response regulator transcription factor [Lutispora saccharofermentans]|uniref:Stage 0 sporulation protein A homolog n=1 Tax=Lutispora saccharofermentans TaxID=3024236 RepID=A0ABT1NGQ9_9FIRM|nr:LytTR family DNA-binding domain-containing protein [Lutispora saccharofermentans]MCQ1530472.1 LytTR family DNA-binding domain-containing protein [Lutispora saccharofermentans]